LNTLDTIGVAGGMAEKDSAHAGDSLSDILRGMWRRKLFILTLWLLGTAGGYAITRLIDPTYQTEAQVLIGNSDIAGERINTSLVNKTELDERTVQSELAVVSSNDLATRVIKDLELTKLPSYNSKLKPTSAIKSLLIEYGFTDDPAKATPEQLALDEYRSNATIYQLPESNVIGIKYQSDDPKNAALIANTVAETYVRSTQEIQAQNTTDTQEWLQREIDDLRSKVSSAEAEVERFRAEKGLVEAQNATLSEQEISAVNAQITTAEAAESEAKARAQEIKELLASSGSVDTSSEVLNSATVSGLRERQLAAQQKVSELSATYLDNHPKMIAARQELRDVERQLRREALKIVGSLDGQAKIAAKQANDLRDKLAGLKSSLTSISQDEAKLKELEREASANRVLLENLLTRYADANARREVNVKPPFARIIQRADVPSSVYFPRKGPLMLLSSLAGLLGGLGIAFLAEMMRAAARLSTVQADAAYSNSDRRMYDYDRRDSAPRFDPPPPPNNGLKPGSIGATSGTMVPPVPPASNITKRPTAPPPPAKAPIVAAPAPVVAPAQKPAEPPPREKAVATTAETAIQLGQALIKLKDEYNILASRFAGQTKFKTDVALFVVATARALAEQKKKILVIDTDPASHALEPLFDLEQGIGLSDLVSGATDFTKVIRKDTQSTAHVISYGMTHTDGIHAQMVERMPSILANVEDVYDIVIVHAGDAAPTTPQMLLGCKSIVMIVPQNENRDLTGAEQAIHDLGAESVMHVTLMQETILS
jgi:polysaccharide biosynthesis transport protein